MTFENLCQVCQERSAPYKCPKCQIKYCSLLCYRDSLHERCTKKFDESEIFDSMNIDGDDQQRADSATTTNDFVRERIEDILKRKLEEKDFHNEQDDEQMEEFFEHMLPSKDLGDYRQRSAGMDDEGEDDEDDDAEAEERIASDDEPLPDLPDDVDESDEKIDQLWNHLTTEERREFRSMLSDGRISHLLNDYKPWKPWWLYKTQAPPLITDVETPLPPSSLPDTVPAIVSPLVPLPSLTSVLPHVHVRFDVFEILFAYVLITIRYRGDFHSYVADAGAEFLHMASRHLKPSADVAIDEQNDSISILHARISLIREYLQHENISYGISEEFFINLLTDTLIVVHGPYPRPTPSNTFVLAALSDLKRFLQEIHEYKPPAEPDANEGTDKQTPTIRNVFHANRTDHRKSTAHRSTESKLRVRSHAAVVPMGHAKERSKAKQPNAFNRKLIQTLQRKIDYFLGWTVTHANRLVMLEFEFEQIEQDLRHQLKQYNRDKTRIEQNLQHIRLHQQTTNGSRRIQEL